MAWNVEGPKQVSLELGSAQIQIVDMLGGTATATGTGTYDLDVGPYPIYIKGSSAQAPASPKPGPPTSKSLRDDV
jgi:hypothetical protein